MRTPLASAPAKNFLRGRVYQRVNTHVGTLRNISGQLVLSLSPDHYPMLTIVSFDSLTTLIPFVLASNIKKGLSTLK
jgi:hypothetical protein